MKHLFALFVVLAISLFSVSADNEMTGQRYFGQQGQLQLRSLMQPDGITIPVVWVGNPSLNVNTGGGGGPSAVTIAEGADVTLGRTDDGATSSDDNATISSRLKLIATLLQGQGSPQLSGVQLSYEGNIVGTSQPLPVDLYGNSLTAVQQTTDNTAAILTAIGDQLSPINNNVNLILSKFPSSALAAGAGNSDGNTLRVVLPFDQAVIPVQSPGFNFVHTSTNTAGTQIGSAGFRVLHAININTLGTGTSTITIYNGTSTAGAVVAVINAALLSGRQQFDVQCGSGIFVAITGTTAPDVTFTYY